MENQFNSEEIISTEQSKLEWNTPEVEVFSVIETTLSSSSGSFDGVALS
jgi:hypothetical protein